MAIAREVWNKEYVLAASLYRGEVLPTLTKYNGEAKKNKSYHLTVIPTKSASYREYGDASASVTYNDASPTDKEVVVKDEAYTPFYLTDEEVNTTDVKVIEGTVKQANLANLNKIEEKVLLDMAINCDSGNMIELASGNEMTLAVLETMLKNLLDNGSNGQNIYMAVNPTFLTRIMNVVDSNGSELFLRAKDYAPGTLETGVFGTILGFKVLLSHNLPTLSDDGTAYDAAGETALVYYDADAMAVYVDNVPRIDSERNIDVVPVQNKTLISVYHGKALVDSGLAGHVREYSL